MHGLNGKADRLLAEVAELKAAATSDDARQAARMARYWAEHDRRWAEVCDRLGALIPDDLHEPVARKAEAALKAHGWYDAGGLMDWLRSLHWCHSALPDGFSEAAVRANVARFLAYDRTQLTATCYTCGLCMTAPWIRLVNWQDAPRDPCLHCGGTDVVNCCDYSRRPPPPWHDNWPMRSQFGPDEPEATSGDPQ
jgi:hypothetical protein